MLSLHDFGLVDLGQTIYIVVITFDAKVLSQIDNLDILGDGVLLEELLALAMAEAEVDDIHLVERHLIGKLQISLANQSFVDIADKVACVTL